MWVTKKQRRCKESWEVTRSYGIEENTGLRRRSRPIVLYGVRRRRGYFWAGECLEEDIDVVLLAAIIKRYGLHNNAHISLLGDATTAFGNVPR